MSFNLILPRILGVVGLANAFVIYAVMSRASDGEAKERGIAEQIHIGAKLRGYMTGMKAISSAD